MGGKGGKYYQHTKFDRIFACFNYTVLCINLLHFIYYYNGLKFAIFYTYLCSGTLLGVAGL